MSLSRRLRFYDGFFTYAKDWQEEQDYHRERRTHHLKHFHSPGIARGLEVVASNEDPAEPNRAKPFGVRVDPGAALDADGEDLIVEQPLFRDLTEDYPTSGVREVVLYLKHAESTDVLDKEYEQHQRTVESVDVEIVDLGKDFAGIEVARIRLEHGQKRLTDDFIDSRHRPQASSIGVDVRRWLVHPERDQVDQALSKTERAFRLLQVKYPVVLYAGDVRHSALTARMLVANESLYYRTLAPTIRGIAELAKLAAEEIRGDSPDPSNIGARANDLLGFLDESPVVTREDPTALVEICSLLVRLADTAFRFSGESTADAGEELFTKSRTTFVLDGTNSKLADKRQYKNVRWEIFDSTKDPKREKPVWPKAGETVQNIKQTVEGGLDVGRYVAVLGITDSDDEFVTAEKTILVSGEPPVARAGVDFWVYEGDPVVLDGGQSIDPDGGKIVKYTWTEKDSQDHRGGAIHKTARANIQIKGLGVGKHTFELVVTDNEDHESEPDTVHITVKAKY